MDEWPTEKLRVLDDISNVMYSDLTAWTPLKWDIFWSNQAILLFLLLRKTRTGTGIKSRLSDKGVNNMNDSCITSKTPLRGLNQKLNEGWDKIIWQQNLTYYMMSRRCWQTKAGAKIKIMSIASKKRCPINKIQQHRWNTIRSTAQEKVSRMPVNIPSSMWMPVAEMTVQWNWLTTVICAASASISCHSSWTTHILHIY